MRWGKLAVRKARKKAEVTENNKVLCENSGVWIEWENVLKKKGWYLNEVLKVYIVNKIQVKLLWRVWTLREEEELERAWERKLFFSIRVSGWNHTKSLCDGVSDNDQERIFKESLWGVNFGNATKVFFCWLVSQIVLIFMADWLYCHRHFTCASVMQVPQKLLWTRCPVFERNREAETPSFLIPKINGSTHFLVGITDLSGSWLVLFFLPFFSRNSLREQPC